MNEALATELESRSTSLYISWMRVAESVAPLSTHRRAQGGGGGGGGGSERERERERERVRERERDRESQPNTGTSERSIASPRSKNHSHTTPISTEHDAENSPTARLIARASPHHVVISPYTEANSPIVSVLESPKVARYTTAIQACPPLLFDLWW